MEMLSNEEIKRLLKSNEFSPEIVVYLALQALYKAKILTLTWSDIGFENSIIFNTKNQKRLRKDAIQ